MPARTLEPTPRRRALALALACHPGPCLAVTAAATAYAACIGRRPAGVCAVGAAVLAGQCSIGWHNDAVDADRDAAAQRPDKPVGRGALERAIAQKSALSAAALAVPLSLASGRRAAALHLVAVGAGWAYNARLKATAASVVPYGLAFGLLPCFIEAGLPESPWPPWWIPAATALLGVAAHGANALPDLEVDRRLGVVGLPHRLGRQATLFGTLAALGAASLLVTVSAPGRGSAAQKGGAGNLRLTATAASAAAMSAGALAAVVARRRPSSRLPFSLVVLAALVDVALVLAAARARR